MYPFSPTVVGVDEMANPTINDAVDKLLMKYELDLELVVDAVGDEVETCTAASPPLGTVPSMLKVPCPSLSIVTIWPGDAAIELYDDI